MLLKHAIFVMIAVLIVLWQKVTAEVGSRDISFGVEHHEATLALRDGFEHTLSEDPDDNSYVFQQFSSNNNETSIRIIVAKRDLQSVDNIESKHISYSLIYNSSLPLLISFDLDSIEAVDLRNVSWYWLPAAENTSLSIPVHLAPKQIGLSYLRFLIRKAKELNHTKPISWPLNTSVITSDEAYMGMLDPSELDSMSFDYVGFPIVVLRGHGVVQLIFRIAVNILVAIFTFTMGCELDPSLLKTYFWRPIGPAIGFGCQFVIMPLVAFTIAKLIPIKQEFAFGLLTIGCSPGGGASNAWSLMLGGDINLSILMTFVSSLSALFMMPLLLFIFGRFFLDVNRVHIPYGNICLQLLQITAPVLAGLGLRCWKPKIAKQLTKTTRILFLFFIVFFLTFGIYANLSIFKLIGAYPIVMPTAALLPWIGFCLAALVAFALRQPRPIIITVALETGIQNIGAAILVLLYSMPQPDGDLGAVMPITVSLFTPIPLYLILLGVTIKRRCCARKPPEAEIHEVKALKNGDALDQTNESNKVTADDLLGPQYATRV